MTDDDLFAKLARHSLDTPLTRKAVALVRERHGEQRRYGDGLTVETHLFEVAVNVAGYCSMYCPQDAERATVAALLHDVLEDTPTQSLEIDAEFGELIGDIVSALSKLDRSSGLSSKERMRRYVDALRSGPTLVRIIKACDVLANMQDVDAMPAEKKQAFLSGVWKKYLPTFGDDVGPLADQIRQRFAERKHTSLGT